MHAQKEWPGLTRGAMHGAFQDHGAMRYFVQAYVPEKPAWGQVQASHLPTGFGNRPCGVDLMSADHDKLTSPDPILNFVYFDQNFALSEGDNRHDFMRMGDESLAMVCVKHHQFGVGWSPPATPEPLGLLRCRHG